MNVILFGAGASFGAGEIAPERPPLGNALHSELARCFPTSWGALPADLDRLFQQSFEQGMERLWQDHSQVVADLMQHMAIYFVQFRPREFGRTLYCRLVGDLSSCGVLDRIALSTLNYECLLEYSIWNRGLVVNYGDVPMADAVTVWKLHGGCNLLPEGIGASRGISFTRGVSFGTALRPARDFNEVLEFCLGDNALPPAMCLFMPGKPIQVSEGSISAIQQAWRNAVTSAAHVVIVGVHPNTQDTHLWDTLAIASCTLSYVGDAIAFERWAAAHRPNQSNRFLGPTFEKSYDAVLSQLLT